MKTALLTAAIVALGVCAAGAANAAELGVGTRTGASVNAPVTGTHIGVGTDTTVNTRTNSGSRNHWSADEETEDRARANRDTSSRDNDMSRDDMRADTTTRSRTSVNGDNDARADVRGSSRSTIRANREKMDDADDMAERTSTSGRIRTDADGSGNTSLSQMGRSGNASINANVNGGGRFND